MTQSYLFVSLGLSYTDSPCAELQGEFCFLLNYLKWPPPWAET